MRKAVTTVLAGGVESPPLALKVWTQLMLWAVGFKEMDVRHRPSLVPLKKLKAVVTNRPQSGRLVVHAR